MHFSLSIAVFYGSSESFLRTSAEKYNTESNRGKNLAAQLLFLLSVDMEKYWKNGGSINETHVPLSFWPDRHDSSCAKLLDIHTSKLIIPGNIYFRFVEMCDFQFNYRPFSLNFLAFKKLHKNKACLSLHKLCQLTLRLPVSHPSGKTWFCIIYIFL